MELTKKNLIIVGGIILALLLGIVLLSKKPTQTGQTNPNPTGRDFNEIEEEKKVITPTPTTVIVKITPTKAVTPTLTQTPTPTNTPAPTSKPTRTPTRRPTATPTPDTSIKSTGVSLNITELHLEKDSSYQVLFRVEPNDTTDKSVTWSSSNGNVATVNNDGKITAKSSGEAVVMAKTSNNKTNFVRVFVFEKPSQSATSTPVPKISIYPTRIFLNYSTAEVKKGEYLQLRANLEPINVTDFSTKWTSSNASIAIVDIKGRVTAKSLGNVVITGKTVNGLEDKVDITVIENDRDSLKSSSNLVVYPTKITLSPPSISLNVGNIYQMSLKIEPSNVTKRNITWESSSPDVVIVDPAGVITANSPGKATITAKTDNGIIETSTISVLF